MEFAVVILLAVVLTFGITIGVGKKRAKQNRQDNGVQGGN